MNRLFRESVKQNYELDALLKKAEESIGDAESVSGDGDRVWYCLTDSFDLKEKSNKIQYLNFNIPGDSDYVAKRFSLVARLNRQGLSAGSINDLPGFFRPFQFVHDGTILSISQSGRLDCQVALTESSIGDDGSSVTRAYQDQPIPLTLTYSHSNRFYGSPSAMNFSVDWNIKRNSVIQCEVSVLSSTNNFDPNFDIDTYRIQGVLEGYKKVRAFK